jgi:probable DNA repair protein
VEKLRVPEYPQLRTALFQAGRKAMSYPHDDSGPVLLSNIAKGGARILVDQAACPFRAFAHFRLDAHELERPEHGLGPLERGTLLHEMMWRVWETLKDQATLKATDAAALERLTLEAASYAIERVAMDRPGRLDGHFAQMERDRLAQVAREWLELEKARPTPFTVTAREEKWKLFAGDLKLEGRIDRMDSLEGGGLAVIDYKSGRVSVGSWLGEPPDDAQLPLYAVTAGEHDVRAVAFARLKTGDRGFSGLARDAETGIPGVAMPQKHNVARKVASTWSELFAFWEGQVRSLGENFAAGDARVDPKLLLRTCERCDLKSLCRVHERLGALDEGEEFADAAPDDEEDE